MIVKFITRALFYLAVAFIVLEVASRLFIDPMYYYRIDTYSFKYNSVLDFKRLIRIYTYKKTHHVDYLFIGSSRVPATINPQIFTHNDNSKIALVAGRGYTTGGLHYQALKNKLSKFPNYLKGADVFIEYSGSMQYHEPFDTGEYRVYEAQSPGMLVVPNLLVPHLTLKTLVEFLEKSPNSWRLKVQMVSLFTLSIFRSSALIKEQLQRLDVPLFNDFRIGVDKNAGVRLSNFKFILQEAEIFAAAAKNISMKSPPVTLEKLDSSVLAHIIQLVTKNGGNIYLFRIPSHSLFKGIYESEKELQNQTVFKHWLSIKGVKIITCDSLQYSDSDFPDTWHLDKSHKDEFSRCISSAFKLVLNQ